MANSIKIKIAEQVFNLNWIGFQVNMKSYLVLDRFSCQHEKLSSVACVSLA